MKTRQREQIEEDDASSLDDQPENSSIQQLQRIGSRPGYVFSANSVRG